ncbi:MAG: HlyD family efflux transporter periplasmic adaptor subunit [Myxococcota bacterium]
MSFLRKNAVPLVAVSAGLLMVVGILRFALGAPATEPRDSDRVVAERVAASSNDLRVQRPEGDWLGGLGIIEPASPERKLAPAVPGRVAAVYVDEGDWVEPGTVLLELESTVERSALASAEADVRAAELELARTGGRVRSQDLAALRGDAEAAEARAALSQAAFERLEATFGSGGVSPEELDRAKRQAEQDRSTADAVRARLQSAEDARPLDVRVAQARLASAQARRDQAKGAVGLRQVVAPVQGEVLEVLIGSGEYAQPGGSEPVMIMGDTRSRKARIDIDERDLAKLSEGARVLVRADAYPDRLFEGRVESVGRRMGRKNVRTDEPTQRIDVKILEVVVDLGQAARLIVGQRVMAYVEASDATEEVADVL